MQLGECQVHTVAPVNNPAHKGRQHRCRSQAGRPTRPSALASRRTQPSASSRRANKDSPSQTREDHNYHSYHPHAFRHTSSWLAPRAGTTSSGQAYKRTSPSRTTGTRHRKGSGTKAPQPRVAKRRRRGAILGILNLLGSGYEFQGWHFS